MLWVRAVCDAVHHAVPQASRAVDRHMRKMEEADSPADAFDRKGPLSSNQEAEVTP